jgi:hypothetical protein
MKLNLYYVVRPSKEGDYSDCKLVSGPYSSWTHAHAAKSSELSSDGMTVVEHTIEVTE